MTDPHISIRFNGEALEVPPGTTVAELLERAAIRTKLVAVEVNLEIVAHEDHQTHQVQTGDTIEVVTLVGGGLKPALQAYPFIPPAPSNPSFNARPTQDR